MKKRYSIYGIMLAVLFCMMAGCGKKDTPQAQPQTEEREEKTTVKEKKTKKKAVQKEEPAISEDAGEGEEEQMPQEQLVLEELNLQLQEPIRQMEAQNAAVSVYAEHLPTETYTSVQSRQMQAASLIKLYIAGCVYEQMEEMKKQESYEGETEELLKIMISASDNDAANTLTTRLGHGDAAAGRAEVNLFCQVHGYTDTYMGRMMLEFDSEEDNYTSVNDCGHFLKAIYHQQMSGSENILTYMKQQERRSKLPAGLPENVMTANKTGELPDMENDVAIVYTDQGDYIVCVMMSQLQDPAFGRSIITEISRIVYQSMAMY